MTRHQALRITWLECLACFGMALGLAVAGMAIAVWAVLT